MKTKMKVMKARMNRLAWTAKENFLRFWKEEDGMGTVEIILIIVVLIGLVLIFKNQMTSIVNGLFQKINSQTSQF